MTTTYRRYQNSEINTRIYTLYNDILEDMLVYRPSLDINYIIDAIVQAAEIVCNDEELTWFNKYLEHPKYAKLPANRQMLVDKIYKVYMDIISIRQIWIDEASRGTVLPIQTGLPTITYDKDVRKLIQLLEDMYNYTISYVGLSYRGKMVYKLYNPKTKKKWTMNEQELLEKYRRLLND